MLPVVRTGRGGSRSPYAAARGSGRASKGGQVESAVEISNFSDQVVTVLQGSVLCK